MIGSRVHEALYSNGPALGTYLSIGGVYYKVVGVFDDEGYERERRLIYIPITTAQNIKNGTSEIHEIFLTVRNSSLNKLDDVLKKIKGLLSNKHKFSELDNQAIFMSGEYEEFKKTASIYRLVELLLWVIGIGIVVTGLIAALSVFTLITNSRIREFGIRRALGASQFSILWLLLVEWSSVCVMAVFGGSMGALYLLPRITELLQIRYADMGIDAIVDIAVPIALVSILIAVFPIWKAASLSISNALRAG